ncbi:flagellar basal body L-ring protein FlgH [Buchnera aphidicola]|uniref:flagellar basal body L-ring protein FlgH n=1 Tax=Buchnera aphidicola TaxID=9 RepID=UPI001560A154|nr:flagellar basal body L-ring protein FlgH [Buchnera aphidicola]
MKKKPQIYQSWYAEKKKYQIGDLIIINLKENIQASNSSSDHCQREKESNTGIFSVFRNSMKSFFPVPKDAIDTPNIDTHNKQSFLHQDNAFANNVITGTITGIIKKILPNGYLEVLGKKIIIINSSTEDIYFSGIINPENIDKNNFISSAHIANCKICYKYHHPTIHKITKTETLKNFLKSFIELSIKMFHTIIKNSQL